MADFITAWQTLDKHEGGYSNHPADRGGETFAGIARRHWPDWPGWAVIDNAKQYADFPATLERPALANTLRALVLNFYRDNFWHGMDGVTSQRIATEVLDCGVNCSADMARRILQRSLNFFSSRRGPGSEYPVLTVDGQVGPKTHHAVTKAVACGYGDKVVGMQNALQAARYEWVTLGLPDQRVFAHGWWNRAQA
jgi:lysozyme family protein